MPLGTATDRELVHGRTIICQGYRRADGLWDIEGHLVDTKAYSFPTGRDGARNGGRSDSRHAATADRRPGFPGP